MKLGEVEMGPTPELRDMINEFMEKLSAQLTEQRQYNEALRSLLSRLTALCHDGYFTFMDRDGRWLNVDSIMEVLVGAEKILEGENKNV